MTDLTIPAYISRPAASDGRLVVVLDYPFGDPIELDCGPIDDPNSADNLPPQLYREFMDVCEDLADASNFARACVREAVETYGESRGTL